MPHLSDARHALQLLRKQKGFAAAALLTLALCIGANTAVFSVVSSVLLRPLPYEAGERLVRIYNSYPGAGVERGGAAAPDLADRRELPALEEVAMYSGQGTTIGESGRPERIQGMEVTPSFFPLLGVPATLGRTFVAEEGERGNEHKVVLSWELWQQRYAASPDVVGSTMRIDDVPHEVVGVMPRGFVFEDPEVRLWVPLAFSEEMRSDDGRHSNNWSMLARLAPGATVEQAQQQVDAQNARIIERLPQYRELLEQVGFRTVVADYRSELTREVRDTLWLLQAGVALVLLIGCVNIANLVLVRATSRHREMATRSALGASPARLARQLATEGAILAGVGGVAGVLLAWGALRAFAAFAAERLPRGAEVALNAPALGVALLVCALAGLIFALVPAMRLRGADLGAVFREEGRTGTAGRGTLRWRAALVTAQVALAFTVLVAAGLVVTSFSRTLAVDPGFRPEGVLTASVSLPVTRYSDAAARRQFAERLLERARALPGVQEAAVTSVLPFGEEMNASAVSPEGYEPRPGDPVLAPVNSRVSDGYFEALEIERVAGRAFTPADAEGAPQVAIIDRFLAERYWPGQDPLGRRIAMGVPVEGEELEWRTVVGVVESVRAQSLTGDEPMGHFYLPAAQSPPGRLFVVLQSAADPAATIGALRAAVTELDPDLPIYEVHSMEERLARSVATDRLRTLLLGGFGALALLLAVIGLYGVLAYSVAQRGVEIGIRMALGSSAEGVFRMVVGQGARLVGIGLAVGLGASLALGRVVESVLYGVEPADPVVLATVLALLTAAALAACAIPARRAMRVDPGVVMRDG